MEKKHINSFYWYVKRFLDIIISLILIILLLPVILLVLLITLINIGIPLIDIRIPRLGLNKKPFYMYKIRTRVYDKDYNSTYTKLSRLIDKLGLNELVQLFNILKGDMSIIGPRPFMKDEPLPEGEISEKRYLVRPGVTGLAQVSGGTYLTHKQKLEFDEIYYDNFGFKQDFIILVKTPIEFIRQIKDR